MDPKASVLPTTPQLPHMFIYVGQFLLMNSAIRRKCRPKDKAENIKINEKQSFEKQFTAAN